MCLITLPLPPSVALCQAQKGIASCHIDKIQRPGRCRGRGLVSPEPWGSSHQLLTFGIYLDTIDNKIWAGPGLLCSSCSSSFEKLGSNNLKCNNLYHYWWLRKQLLDKLPELKPSEALAIMNPEYKPFLGLFYSKLVDRRKIVNEWLLNCKLQVAIAE